MNSISMIDVAVILIVWVLLVALSLVASTLAIAVFEYLFVPATGRLLQLISVAVACALLITQVSPPCCHECPISLGFIAIRGGGDGAQHGAVPEGAQSR